MFKGASIIKNGRNTDVKERFRSYGDLEVIQVAEGNDPMKAERALHELARIYFGKAVYRKEYYECDNRLKALEVFMEIANGFKETDGW
jgi:hypothetical protein